MAAHKRRIDRRRQAGKDYSHIPTPGEGPQFRKGERYGSVNPADQTTVKYDKSDPDTSLVVQPFANVREHGAGRTKEQKSLESKDIYGLPVLVQESSLTEGPVDVTVVYRTY